MRLRPTWSSCDASTGGDTTRAVATSRSEGEDRVTRLTSALRRFAGARRGAVAIEFALVGMPFLLLICGIMLVGFMLFCSSTLDYATQKAARQIMVGSPQNSSLTAGQFRTSVLCPFLPTSVFDCNKVVVDLETVTESVEPTDWYDFVKPNSSSLISPPSSNSQASFCMGGGNTYQVLRVVYPFPNYFVLFTSSPSAAQSQFAIQSTAAFKNEPFQGGASAGC